MVEEIPFNLQNKIKIGENTNIEFKEAKNKIPDTLFDTICAMLNRNGGHIFLGVNDYGEIIGIDINSVDKIKKGFC